MPTTRGQQKAALPSAADLKAELMKKNTDGYIKAEKMISPWNFGTTAAEQEAARQHIISVTLTPENRALIEKVKSPPGYFGPETMLKDQMKAVIQGRSLVAEAAQSISDRMYVNKGLATGGRKRTRANRKGGRRHKKTRRT